MRGFAAIGLDNPKTSANVGSVLRAASVYGAAMVAVSGIRYRRNNTDTTAAFKHIPFFQCQNLYQVIPYACVPVAVELAEGARSLFTYTHPESAFYIFGAEDATLGKRVLDWCRDIIYIPTPGPCMNLAATFNVVLYDRLAKTSLRNSVFGQKQS
jgi:tRNA(Leu) C34 or U34 (ribose-2'-O)-methylase TrmL